MTPEKPRSGRTNNSLTAVFRPRLSLATKAASSSRLRAPADLARFFDVVTMLATVPKMGLLMSRSTSSISTQLRTTRSR